MESLTSILIVVVLTWLGVYTLFYSPRSRIKALKKEIIEIPIRIDRQKKEMPEESEHFDDMCSKAIKIRYNIIDALLEYYFDPVADEEYIRENKSL